MPGEYEVGYGKPPKHTRFKKGQSGNPKGRPEDTKNLKTDLREEMNEKITIREGADERRISKQRALLKSLTLKAIKGDTRAANVLLNMVLRVLEAEPSEPGEAPLTAEERQVLETLESRLLRDSEKSTPDRAGKGKRSRRRLRLTEK